MSSSDQNVSMFFTTRQRPKWKRKKGFKFLKGFSWYVLFLRPRLAGNPTLMKRRTAAALVPIMFPHGLLAELRDVVVVKSFVRAANWKQRLSSNPRRPHLARVESEKWPFVQLVGGPQKSQDFWLSDIWRRPSTRIQTSNFNQKFYDPFTTSCRHVLLFR